MLSGSSYRLPHFAAISTVTVQSTLKQGSLCPEDKSATFTCNCTGDKLVWIVSGEVMEFSTNAEVSARRQPEPDVLAILTKKKSRNNGDFNWVSTLTISERPQAAEPISVQCHNGSANLTKTIEFWATVAGLQLLLIIASYLLYRINSL